MGTSVVAWCLRVFLLVCCTALVVIGASGSSSSWGPEDIKVVHVGTTSYVPHTRVQRSGST